jgi:hypothetical protein
LRSEDVNPNNARKTIFVFSNSFVYTGQCEVKVGYLGNGDDFGVASFTPFMLRGYHEKSRMVIGKLNIGFLFFNFEDFDSPVCQ